MTETTATAYVLTVPDLHHIISSRSNLANRFLDHTPLLTNYNFDALTDRILKATEKYYESYTQFRRHAILKGGDNTCHLIISETQYQLLMRAIEEDPQINMRQLSQIPLPVASNPYFRYAYECSIL